jgi:hypothetical protein
MNCCTLTVGEVTLRVTYGYPSRDHLYYIVEAEHACQPQRAVGSVRYADLSLAWVSVECLEFFEAPAWLLVAWGLSKGARSSEPSGSHAPMTFQVVLEALQMDQLAAWVAADYRQRFYAVLAMIEADSSELPEYRLVWYRELCREAGVNPCEDPMPTELATAFRLVEAHASAEVLAAEAQRRRWNRIIRMGGESARWNTWLGEHLHGKVPTSVYPMEQLRQGGVPVSFAMSRYDVAVTYEPVYLQEEGEGMCSGYLETVGETVLAYVPPEVAERWYGERWQSERTAERALYVLNCMLHCDGRGVSSGDYIRWIFAQEGEEVLVALACSGAPVPVPWSRASCYGLASKFYRVPLSILLGEEHYAGYGVPGISIQESIDTDGPLQGEAWDQVRRLNGWVLLGFEEDGVWPCRTDIDAHQLDVRRMCYGQTVLFG